MLQPILNIEFGSDGTDIESTIDAANAFLASNTTITKQNKNTATTLHGALANYNEGITGPGHCTG